MLIKDFKAENFKPSKSRLLIQLETPKEVTESKIVLPDEFKKKMVEDIRKPFGIVVSIGVEVANYKVGDKVYFAKQSGREIENEKEFFLLMHEEEIYGKFVNEGAN